MKEKYALAIAAIAIFSTLLLLPLNPTTLVIQKSLPPALERNYLAPGAFSLLPPVPRDFYFLALKIL